MTTNDMARALANTFERMARTAESVGKACCAEGCHDRWKLRASERREAADLVRRWFGLGKVA